jgi:hypothetical protein
MNLTASIYRAGEFRLARGAALAAALADGWALCPERPSHQHRWDRVAHEWVHVEPPPPPAPTLPRALRYQIREWLLEEGLDPELVPSLIRQAIPSTLEAEKAVNRWLHVEQIPRDHPMVDIVGGILGWTPAAITAAWPAICAK